MYYASYVRVFNIGSDMPDPENLPNVESDDYYLPDEEIKEFLLNYLEYSEDTTTTIEDITTEFNMHTTYLALCKMVGFTNLGGIDVGDKTSCHRHPFPRMCKPKNKYNYYFSANSNEWDIWCYRLEDFPVDCL